MAGGGRRAGGRAFAALGAGVERHEVLPAQIRHGGVPDLLGGGVGRELQQPLTGRRVAHGHVGWARQHVHGFREGDGGDKAEGDEAVEPPRDVMGELGGRAPQPHRPEPLHEEPADGRPVGEVLIRLGEPETLEQESRERQEPEGPEEDPVARPVEAAVVLPRLAVGSRVVETGRTADGSVDGHEAEAAEQEDAGEVERQLVGEVEAALPEIPVEERPREIGVDPEDGRAGEERHEAVEDHDVAEPGETVVAPDSSGGRRRSPPSWPAERRAHAARWPRRAGRSGTSPRGGRRPRRKPRSR